MLIYKKFEGRGPVFMCVPPLVFFLFFSLSWYGVLFFFV